MNNEIRQRRLTRMDEKLKLAQEIHDSAINIWMHADSGEPLGESIAIAGANWATDNLEKISVLHKALFAKYVNETP